MTSPLPPTGSRRLVETTVIDRLEEGRSVVISGPGAGGTTHVLRSLKSHLEATGLPTEFIHTGDPEAASRISAVPPTGVILADDIDRANPTVLHALRTQMADGRRVIGTAATDRPIPQDASPFAPQSSADGGWAMAGRPELVQLALPIMPDAEVRALVHQTAQQLLDATTVEAIVEMSWGRPGWVIDLVRIAESGLLTARPFPHISRLGSGHEHLQSLRHFWSWPAIRDFSDGDCAAAIVLSEIEPRTVTGARFLVGSDTISALLETGVLLPLPDNPRLHGVPPLYAAAIAARTPMGRVDTVRLETARRLHRLSGTGIPPSAREAYFTAHAFGGSQSPIDHEQECQRLLRRAADDYLEFGFADDARDFLINVAAGDAEGTAPLAAARTTTVLHGPLAANRIVRAAFPAQPSPDHSDDTTSPAQFGAEYLRSCLNSELLSHDHPANHAPEASPAGPCSLQQARLVFSYWTGTAPITTDIDQLMDIRTGHPVPEVALATGYLLDLECMMAGRLPAEGATTAERGARLVAVALNSPPELRDLVTLCAVAEALLVLLCGEYQGSERVLFKTAAMLPAAPFHRAWTLHLVAASRALAAGATKRAAKEWDLFAECTPRFLPARLRRLIAELAAELHGPGGSGGGDRLPGKFVAYARGNVENLKSVASPPDALALATGAEDIPLVDLARHHVAAADAQHSGRLFSVAAELASYELWAPAAHALRNARNILQSRGATRGVTDCDEQLAVLDTAARAQNSWFSVELLPMARTVRLTPRQLTAARFAAAGLSNKEIGLRMNCSVRTAESHLAQARAKLGASKRSDLADRIERLVDGT